MIRLWLPAYSALAVLSMGAAAGPLTPLRVALPASPSTRGAPGEPVSLCPPHMLPDRELCVHIPTEDEDSDPEAAVLANAHRERSGRWQVYSDIPRRPDRPLDYDAYRYPVAPGLPGGHSVISGYDLDKPDPAQRRGRTLHAVGHGGVDLPQVRGTPALLVALEHQQGDAEVLFAGPLFGTTVITRQTVREAGHLRDYVVLFGHLDAIATDVLAGATLKEGAVVGLVGDTGLPELVHLHWEVRRARDGVDLKEKAKLGGATLLADDVSVVCDPRNVAPLK